MTPEEFGFLAERLRHLSGLDLGPDKLYLAESRLRPVWQAAGLSSSSELVRVLMARRDGRLDQAVVEAMATHETTFFRDRPVFDALRDIVLPRLAAARAPSRRLRVWSAAASTGQEAYSVAMLLADAKAMSGWDVSVLGTDISGPAIERARAGTYTQFEVQRGLPVLSLLRHFAQTKAGWTISAEMRRAVSFRTLNLLDPLGGLAPFDLILCRNLLIYLDGPTRIGLLERLAALLSPGGVLCLGASETVIGPGRLLAPDPAARGFWVRATAPARPARLEVVA